MKKLNLCFFYSFILICLIFGIHSKCSAQSTSFINEYPYSIEMDDSVLVNSSLISTSECVKDDRLIIEKIYLTQDGITIIDTFDVSAVPMRSSNGSDTATRTRTISGWGSITLTACFDWYTDGVFSYVRCSNIAVGRTLQSDVVVDTWNYSYTANYVSVGSAKAEVTYSFHRSYATNQITSGTFRITCTDSGTISDNG